VPVVAASKTLLSRTPVVCRRRGISVLDEHASGQAALSGVTAANGTTTFSGSDVGKPIPFRRAMTGYTSNTGSFTVVAGSVAPLSINAFRPSLPPPVGVFPDYPVEASNLRPRCVRILVSFSS